MTATNRVLGVHATPQAIYLSVVTGGEVRADCPPRITVADGLRSRASLAALLGDLRNRLAEARVDEGAVLVAQTYGPGAKATIARVGAETLLRSVATELGIEVGLLHRATARTLMGLPRAGSLDRHVEALLPVASGKYWGEGCRMAAFTALAYSRRQ